MSFGIDSRKLKKLIDLYHPNNQAEEMKYLLLLKGEDDLYINLETCPFQGISLNSVEDRISVYGPNQLKDQPSSLLDPFLRSASLSQVYLPVILSILCLILELVGVGNGEGTKIVTILVVAILNWVLLSMERFWFSRRKQRNPEEMEERMATVIRENNHERVRSSELVVGDLVVIKEGDIVPADGWVIDGLNLSLSEPHINGNLQVRKASLRDCLTELKTKIEIGQKEGEYMTSNCSPVLIGGSLVQSGQGRMLILCVGQLSRQGAFLQRSQLQFKENILLSKLVQLAQTVNEYLFYFNFLFCLVYFAKTIRTASDSSWSVLINQSYWNNLITVLWTFVVGLPQGLQIGVAVGLWLLKLRAYQTDQIWADYCEDIPKMGNVSIVCLDQSFERGKTVYREWWNEENHHFFKECVDGDKAIETEEGEQEEGQDLHENFRSLLQKVSIFKECKQPNQYYLGTEEPSLKKNIGEEETVFTELVGKEQIHYICQNGNIRLVLANFDRRGQNLCLALGMGEHVIQICSSIISKSTGQINELTKGVAGVMTDITSSMNRRLMSSFAMAYFISPAKDIEEQLQAIRSQSMTFVCLLGASGIKEHNQYQITNKLRQSGINLMLVSSSNLTETTMRARNLGVNSLEEESLSLTGEEFMTIIGDIQCSECKKSICSCSGRPGPPRVKNVQNLRHMQKGFRVLGEANSSHKYALMVGLENSDNLVAYLGYGPEDKPALAQSYLPISVGSNLQGCAVDFPRNDIRTVSKFIIWSRFSHEFVSRYLQLILPASIVAIILLLGGALACQQIVVSVLPLTWVCTVICPLLALGLSWERPSENLLQQSRHIYQKETSILTQSVKKQIVGMTIWQAFVLVVVMLLGHLIIPETVDEFDSTIGVNWAAKYSDSSLSFVANGLSSNPLLNTPSYTSTYKTYDVHSRHLTVVFNIYALMQIFNFLNCRKTKDKMINIVEGIQLQTVIIFLSVLSAHFAFMLLSGQEVGFYPYPLAPSQWMVSFGAAITVWLASFVLRLMPQPPVSSTTKVAWVNRSVNLGIKLVVKKPSLAQFDLEEEIQLKIQ